jgi:formate-dependent nitrite reductase cytochrome c552 subunit
MGQAGVKCEDCHMPYMSKSAVSLRKYVGDVRTHLFKINLDAGAKPFKNGGSEARGFVTSEFACLSCHYDHDKNWAATYKGVIHSLK